MLLGNGDGIFRQPVGYSGCGGSFGLAGLDVNNEGKMDLVQNGLAGVCVSLGNGDGTFQAPVVTTYTASAPLALALGDFNDDGKIDAVVTDDVADDALVLLANGDGTFQPPALYPAGTGTYGIATGDLNGDG